jgi:hypothetical protein
MEGNDELYALVLPFNKLILELADALREFGLL